MNKFPAIDMAGALRLTRQGRLKEAVALLRGKMAAPPPGEKPGEKLGASGLQFVDHVFDGLALHAGRILKVPFGPAEDKQPELEPQGSRFETRSFANAAGSRNYKLFIPSSYSGQAMRLVVMLHGCTQSPDDFAAGTRMNDLAEAQGFLAAYPEQSRSANVTKCWNWFNAANQRRDQGEASLIAGITRQVMVDFNVLPGGVYVAGLSAGGAAAAIMGSEYPELYAAIGVHSGLACGAAADLPSAMNAMKNGAPPKAGKSNGLAQAIPAIVFHGDRDNMVNVANEKQVVQQAKGGAELRAEVRKGEAAGMRYTRTVFTDSSGRDVLEEWLLHGAGHAWSGGSKAGSFADPHGPDASCEMVRFFFSQPA